MITALVLSAFIPKAHMAYWVHQIDPFVFRFPFPFFTEGIRWYGVAYLLGFFFTYLFLKLCSQKRRSPLSSQSHESLLISIALGMLMGGRVGYVIFYDFAFWTENPLWIFQFWHGGMSFHGAVIGIAIAIACFSQYHHISFFQLTDLCCVIAPLGIFFGRIANFINGELFGKITTLPWAIRFPQSAISVPIAEIPPRHPSQLYEALLEGLILLFILQRRFWKHPTRIHGRLTADFLCLYSIMRILAEIFREPDAPLLWQLSRGQVLSMGLGFLGIGVYFWTKGQDRKHSTYAMDDSAKGAER
ncbi:MAG: prolipoprotein diacylglyceryl transferase [Puniceicoccales bacterium]|nr:prolipoprotein diacylglyceryl transferase [Puniceicoccales bacterium]